MKTWIKIVLVTVLAGLIFTLWFFSLRKEQNRNLISPIVTVHVDGADALLNENELLDRIVSSRWFIENQKVESFKIKSIEEGIRRMEEVRDVSVYRLIGGQWKIDVWLRKPIARIFKTNGKSFYLDSEGATITKTNLHTANVLIFSGEITEPIKGQNAKEIINNDSLKNIRKLDEIYRISNYVCNDPMLRPLIGQVYLEKNGDFVLIPIIGDLKIIFGSAYSDDQVKDKFTRLKIFFKEGLPYEGWDKYSEINLIYNGQVVCRKRRKEE